MADSFNPHQLSMIDTLLSIFSMGAIFPLGRLVSTPGALEALARVNIPPAVLLARHSKCDWGDVHELDKGANDLALKTGSRLVSVYTLPDGTKVWIITEADRSATTILLPSEY